MPVAGAEAVTLRVVFSPELSWAPLGWLLMVGAFRSVLVVLLFVLLLPELLLPLLLPELLVPPVTVRMAPVVKEEPAALVNLHSIAQPFMDLGILLRVRRSVSCPLTVTPK